MRRRQTAVLGRGSPTDAKGRMRRHLRTRQQRTGDNSVDNQLALGYGELEPGPTSKAAPKNGAVQKEKHERPTQDQMYLSRMLSPDPDELSLSPQAMQRLNNRYGVRTVVAAMRAVHGFPPPVPPRSLFAYIERICKGQV